MGAPNWANRTLFHADNLGVMRGMNSESVDLIATDPPFNKSRDFHATPDSLAAGASFQDRWSWERDVHPAWVDQLKDDHPRLLATVESARQAAGDDMGAFACFMAVRLLEMHRLLKPTGSLYLHCDPTASHYLKAVLDAIFGGRKRCKAEITWKRSSAHNDGKQGRNEYGQICDHILFYAKGREWTWNTQHTEYSADYEGNAYRHLEESTNRRFRRGDLTAAKPGGDTEYEWRVKRRAGESWTADLDAEHESPVQGWDYRGVRPYKGRYWAYSREKMAEFARTGRLVYTRSGRPEYKRYLDEMPGRPLQNLWTDIGPVSSRAKERTDFPTQKPRALYERILRVSSNEGDVVLDPFAGCATTCVAAERLRRQWVGIDIWDGAHRIVIDRLKSDGPGKLAFGEVHYATDPPTRTDDGLMAGPFLKTTTKTFQLEPPGPKMTRDEMHATLVAQHGPTCQGCDRQFDDSRYLELDHKTPRAEGGLNHISNRTLLCGPCNRLKSNTLTLTGLRRKNKKLGHMAKPSRLFV